MAPRGAIRDLGAAEDVETDTAMEMATSLQLSLARLSDVMIGAAGTTARADFSSRLGAELAATFGDVAADRIEVTAVSQLPLRTLVGLRIVDHSPAADIGAVGGLTGGASPPPPPPLPPATPGSVARAATALSEWGLRVGSGAVVWLWL